MYMLLTADSATKLAVQWALGTYFGTSVTPDFALVVTNSGGTSTTSLTSGNGYATSGTYAGSGSVSTDTGLGQYYTPLDVANGHTGTITVAIKACIAGVTYTKCAISNEATIVACPGEIRVPVMSM
jgi:hypothetical protein